ncbi:unnamed protein product [Caenorhabditis angaria]|uniref:Uncharacterized protein n=1 Tax=Caenorhabditis angaria TaxID=860376 RepID=A0A9P1I5S1_9PELO|nr:unnamed protein product [Caenorhabditis angaria]
MVKNYPFSMNDSLLNSSFLANSSFGNTSFNGDKENQLTPQTVSRIIKKEHENVCNALKFNPPKPLQYQNSLNELINLYERCQEEAEDRNLENLVISVFLKLCANVLSCLEKPEHQFILYKLAETIGSNINFEKSPENLHLQKWADRIVFEAKIQQTPKNVSIIDFSTSAIIDDLELSTGKLQFVRTSIFEAARSLAENMGQKKENDAENIRLNPDLFEDESFLQLVLWYFKFDAKHALSDSFLTRIFSTLSSSTLTNSLTLLDIKLFLVSLFVTSSTTTETGITAKFAPKISANLTITNIEKECWRAMIQSFSANRPKITASARLRLTQIQNAVRLIEGGSEDVRVLFEAWKYCLQQSAILDDEEFERIKQMAEVYRAKMNQLLAFGPLYSTNSSAFVTMSSDRRQDVKALFPLQLDYQFVDTVEAGHIGVVINSTEGYLKFSTNPAAENAENESDTSFRTASEKSFGTGSADKFYSPMKNNRTSIIPDHLRKLISKGNEANRSFVSTKSVILAPNEEEKEEEEDDEKQNASFSSQSIFANLPRSPQKPQNFGGGDSKHSYFAENVQKTENLKAEEEEEEDEEDPLENALFESSRLFLEQQKLQKTPTKDAQTETEPENEQKLKCSDAKKLEFTPVKSNDSRFLDDLLEASTEMLRTLALKKVGLEIEASTPKEPAQIFQHAENQLNRIHTDLKKIITNFEENFAKKPEEHNCSKCLGCQSDEKQEAALRVLENLAISWDLEGRN